MLRSSGCLRASSCSNTTPVGGLVLFGTARQCPVGNEAATEGRAHLRLELCVSVLRGVDLGPSQSCRGRTSKGRASGVTQDAD